MHDTPPHPHHPWNAKLANRLRHLGTGTIQSWHHTEAIRAIESAHQLPDEDALDAVSLLLHALSHTPISLGATPIAQDSYEAGLSATAFARALLQLADSLSLPRAQLLILNHLLHDKLPINSRGDSLAREPLHRAISREHLLAARRDRLAHELIDSDALTPDERVALIIHSFPYGASLLEDLTARCESLPTHIDSLMSLYLQHPDHSALTHSMLRTIWQQAPEHMRAKHLQTLSERATRYARQERWVELFIELANNPKEHSILLSRSLRETFPDPSWANIAASLITSDDTQLRDRALETLEAHADHHALPALAQARPLATRRQQRRIDALIAKLVKLHPDTKIARGALSVSSTASHLGALSAAPPRGALTQHTSHTTLDTPTPPRRARWLLLLPLLFTALIAAALRLWP
jgi:hypothetical protein